MRRRSGKRLSRRHLIVVFVLFGGVGVLVVLASLREPLNIVINEPPEITNKRTDTENNAYYVLADAVRLLPQPPPPLKLKDDQGWEYNYAPKDDSLAQMLDIRRSDDDPIFIQYLDATVPALDRAVAAFDKPYFLYPPHSFDYAEHKKRVDEQNRLLKLADLLLAQARVRPCSDDPHQDACVYLYNTARLTRLLATDGRAGFLETEDAAEIIRRASASHQAIITTWLKQCRAEWKPLVNEIDRNIRNIYAQSPGSDRGEKMPWPVRVFWNARASQLKRALYREETHIRTISCMTIRQYEEYLNAHPEFRGTRFAADFSVFRAGNAYFFFTVDGLLTVLALESFHRNRGVYPDSLSELVPQYMPQLPENPFRPDPFVYAREGSNYILYCLGEERRGGPPRHVVVYTPKDRRGKI